MSSRQRFRQTLQQGALLLVLTSTLAACWSPPLPPSQQPLGDAPRKLSLDGVAGASLRDGDEILSQKEFRLGLEASYELDLWGRILAEAEAEELEARAIAEDYQTLAVSLSAEIATTVYRLTEAKAQLELDRTQIKAPFDAQILERFVELGSQVSARDRVARIIETSSNDIAAGSVQTSAGEILCASRRASSGRSSLRESS